MALTTLYNATNHPLTWDKVNEVLKIVDDNFTFVTSAVTTGDLSAITQDIIPGSGTWDIGSASKPWDNVFANNLTVNGSFAAGTLQADVYGDVFGSNSSRLVDFANSKLTGDVDNGTVDTTNLTTQNIYSANPAAPMNITVAGSTKVAVKTSEVEFLNSPVKFHVPSVVIGNNTTTLVQVGDSTVANTFDVKSRTITIGGSTSSVNIGYNTQASNIIIGHPSNILSQTVTVHNAIINGDVTGDVTGNVTGNVVGDLVGNLVGSVFSDDSAGILVDGTNGTLNTSKLSNAGASDGDVLVWSDSNNQWEPGAGGGGGGTGLGARGTLSASTSSLSAGSTGNTVINSGYKSYALLKIQTNVASWVRIYTSVAARTADASRAQTDDPAPDAGVIAEIVTSGAATVIMSPGVIGWNDESPVSNTIPIAATNLTGGATDVTVTLTLIQLEA
jgi:hypothetical protein